MTRQYRPKGAYRRELVRAIGRDFFQLREPLTDLAGWYELKMGARPDTALAWANWYLAEREKEAEK